MHSYAFLKNGESNLTHRFSNRNDLKGETDQNKGTIDFYKITVRVTYTWLRD